MKIVKSVNALGQVIGGNNCSCIMDGYDDHRFLKQVNSISECRAACCTLNLLIYIRSYEWNGQIYRCFKDMEDFDSFFGLDKIVPSVPPANSNGGNNI